MAISDINKAMAMYAQPSEFDQTAWKTAFDLANGFTTAAENGRKHNENMATQDWRVAMTNALDQAKSAESQNNLIQQQGLKQGLDFYHKNAVDAQGRVRTPEEMLNLANKNQTLNPYLFSQLLSANQQYAKNTAQETAQFNPQMASQYLALAGLSPNTVDNSGNVINFNTGETIGQILDPNLLTQYVAGNAWQGSQAAIKAQQEAEKAKAVAEARLPATLEAIQARGQNAMDKQNGWIGYQQDQAAMKAIDQAVKNIVSVSGGDKAKLNDALSALVGQYPNLKDYIGQQAAIELNSTSF